MKRILLSKKSWQIFLLIILSYLSGFLCYLPSYIVLVIAAVISAFSWYEIASISKEIKNRKAKKFMNILPFYKVFITVLGYAILELPETTNLPQLNIFTELTMGFVLFVLLTQIHIFETRLLLIENSFTVLVLQILLSVVFALIPIISYYFTFKMIRRKNTTNDNTRDDFVH